MNILDMMNKITELSKPIVEAKEETTTHKGGTTTTDEKGTKHKGKYGTDYQGDEDDDKTDDYGKKKKAKPAVAAPAAEKRGRGRPAKGSDKDGNVMKPDWSSFGAKKDVKLKPWDKKATTKHSLKDWIENLDSVLNEAPAVIAKPAPGAVSLSTAAEPNKVIGTATGPAAQAISQGVANGTVNLDNAKALKEVERNHMGETEYHGYYKWRVACRKAGAVEFVGDRDIDEGHDSRGKAVGEWDGVVGSVYGDAHKQRPAAPAGPALAEAKKKAKPDFLDKDKDGDKKEPFKKAVKDAGKKVEEAKKAKPDFLDKDKDGDKKEPFKKAVKDAGKNPADSKYDSRAGRRNGKDDLKAKQVEEGKDEGKPGKNFAKIAKSAGKEYGSKAAGERVAGAVRNKLAKQGKLEEGKVKELSMDLDDRSMKPAEFQKKYGKSKAEMQASMKNKPAEKKPTSKIKESILRESHDTMAHIISKFKHEVKKFVAGEDLDEDLYDALYDYYCDMGEMPYGTMKARDGDPYEWVTQRFDSDVQNHDVPVDEAVNPSLIPAVTRKAQGVNFPATLGQVNQNDSLSHLPNLKAAGDRLATASPWGSAPVKNVQFEGWAKELDTLLAEGMNVVANTGLGDGPDSVTISATDEDAQHLLSIVKSAGLGMFANDERQEGDSPQMSVQSQDNPNAEIGVVDDHDDMLGLIRKMTGQGGQPGAAEVEVDEEQGMNPGEAQGYQDEEMAAENNPTFGEVEPDEEGSSDEEVQQATEKLEKVHDAWSEADGGETDQDEPAADTGEEEPEEPATDDAESEEPAEPEEEKEEVDEALANGADDTFESDIDFMQNVISGGMNGRKRTQSVGSPVTIASTPMRESTDLLKDWRTLSGIK